MSNVEECPGCGKGVKFPCGDLPTPELDLVGYQPLYFVLQEALQQAAEGKGKARHASGEPFHAQPICSISRDVGLGFALGQAIKKIRESQRLPGELGIHELLGAINYIAAAIIVRREDGGPVQYHP